MAGPNGSAAPWTGQIVALVLAHNEEASIKRTVAALRAQTAPADRIILVAGNRIGRTAVLAERAAKPPEVFPAGAS
ncbi:MAG TPA: glycosyltransferase [Streptosporangiaceae bacterium]|nr:glycosyltransferase [Streptosporangiaceae bacterium]